MTKMYHLIPVDEFKKLQFQAGALLKTFDPTGATPIKAEDLIALTTGGITVSCVPQSIDLASDIDEVPANTLQFKHITGWDCGLSATLLTTSTSTVKMSLGAADIDPETGKVKPREDYQAGDFEAVWWHGNLMGGGYAAVKLMNAVSDGGFSYKTSKDGKGQLTLSLKGHYDLEDTSVVPMEFYVKEASE